MGVRDLLSRVLAAGMTLVLALAGCGAAQEEYTIIERPSATGAIHDSPPQHREAELPADVRQQLKACIDIRAGQWAERSYAVQYDAKANERGTMLEVKLRDTTLPDSEVEACLRHVIGTMTIPEQALRSRSSRPFSGGERMTRERRGPVGNSDSANPLVLLGPIIVEAVGVEVIIEIGVGIIAAIGTIVTPKKKRNECLDKYVACMDSPLGNLVVDKHGYSLCQTCWEKCVSDEAWPSAVKGTHKWHACM